MPAQHQLPGKERDTSRKIESARLEASSEEEGAKTNKSQSRGGTSVPEKSSKKKARKKKKKKANQDLGESQSQTKKHPIFLESSLELLCLQREDGITSDLTAKVPPGQTSGNPLLAFMSGFSFSTPDDYSDLPKESLRWDGVLDDPVAEEERLWNYRLNRRKRYGAYLQKNQAPEPSLALKNLPELCKVAQKNEEHFLCRSKSTPNTLLVNKNLS